MAFQMVVFKAASLAQFRVHFSSNLSDFHFQPTVTSYNSLNWQRYVTHDVP
jgi:hypothetical protein